MDSNAYRVPESLVERIGTAINTTMARLELPGTPHNAGELLRSVLEAIEIYDGDDDRLPPYLRRG